MTASVGRAADVGAAAPDQPRLFHPPGVIRLLTPAEERALSAPHRTDDRTTRMPAGDARRATTDAGLNP
jgi:hypothetical protein